MPKLKPVSQESEIIEQAKDAQAKQEASRGPNTPPSEKYSTDTQLPAGGSDTRGKVVLEVPQEVGYVSRFPISAYVISSFYGLLMVFFVYDAYSAMNSSNSNFMTSAVLEPLVSAVVASFLILALLGGSKIVRWTGLLVSVLSLAYMIYMIKTRIDSFSIKTDGQQLNQIIGDYVDHTFMSNLWVYMLGALLLVVTIIYSASPKYKAAYR